MIVATSLVSPGNACERGLMAARRYRLEIEGEVSDCSWCELDGLGLSYAHGNTVLVGLVQDQSALRGLLQRAADLGLTLVSVNPVDNGSQS